MSKPTSFTKRLDLLVTHFDGYSAADVVKSVERLKTAGVVSEETLMELLMQPTVPVSLRLDACWLLPRIGLEGAECTLITLLSDEEPRVRAEAAMSLGLLSNDTVVDSLLSRLKTDPELQVRLAVVHSLGTLSHTKSAHCLQALISNPEEDATVRADATEALAHVDADGVIDALLSALQDPSPTVRFSAAYALGEQGDPVALPALRVIADTDVASTEFGDVAARAAEAIEDINNRQLLDDVD
ncbi:putative phycocyanin operon protein Z [Enhygromyxa salina]|uniref:Putative phycocyanin operon protein Z n=2 Tax=Enhygromyxa salina TaxID=215803 RepID=A0A2S9YFX8_9BACT|nr:putative phycocyanin operon protein Z [Enhygromyxa salina]